MITGQQLKDAGYRYVRHNGVDWYGVTRDDNIERVIVPSASMCPFCGSAWVGVHLYGYDAPHFDQYITWSYGIYECGSRLASCCGVVLAAAGPTQTCGFTIDMAACQEDVI